MRLFIRYDSRVFIYLFFSKSVSGGRLKLLNLGEAFRKTVVHLYRTARVLTTPVTTDCTIAPTPPKPAIFFTTNVSWLLDTRQDTIAKKRYPYMFLCAKVYND